MESLLRVRKMSTVSLSPVALCCPSLSKINSSSNDASPLINRRDEYNEEEADAALEKLVPDVTIAAPSLNLDSVKIESSGAYASVMRGYQGASFLGAVCPPDVLAIIFGNLDAISLGRVGRVCKRCAPLLALVVWYLD